MKQKVKQRNPNSIDIGQDLLQTLNQGEFMKSRHDKVFGGLAVTIFVTILALAVAILSNPQALYAKPLDFGGYQERFKGAGDNVPPECQIDVPQAASEPFFIKWNCIDDNALQQDIQTELWIYRKNEEASEQVVKYLGFPAAAYIDTTILKATSIQEGLPVSFRLLARDRAGITTVSNFLVVSKQASVLSNCTLNVTTEDTASTGSTTGLSESEATLSNVSVSSQEVGDSGLRLFTATPLAASPCDISSVCSEDEEVSFDTTLTVSESSTTSGTLRVSPGSVSAEVTGTVAVTDGVLISSVDVTGTTTIEGQEASLSLKCSD